MNGSEYGRAYERPSYAPDTLAGGNFLFPGWLCFPEEKGLAE